MNVKELLSDTNNGHRLSNEEAVILLSQKGNDIYPVLDAADKSRFEKAGDIVTFVKNQNIHITNICKNLCGFCGFGRSAGDDGSFCDDQITLIKKTKLAKEREVSEICLLSGVHPDFTISHYVEMLATVHSVFPGVHIHAFSPDEVAHASDKDEISTKEVLFRMKKAGLGSLQGTAAEILVDSVRKIICPNKISTEKWVKIIKEAHSLEIPTTATIMYGSIEGPKERVEHLSVLRDIQEATNGFTELVPLTYIHENTPLFRSGIANPGATGREDLLLHAVSRLYLDNFKNIQVSWGKLGVKLAQMALLAGANDFAGTMWSDDVSVNAGAEGADYLAPTLMKRIAEDIGRQLKERDTLYNLI